MMTVYEALAEPMRRKILDLLHERPRMVNELVEELKISQPGVSKHLRILREVQLVRVRQQSQRHYYEIDPAPLMEIDTWLASYRHLWAENLERLDGLLARLQAPGQKTTDTEKEKE
jgi:DNA-binding transcriptional ArsR family regulator